MHSSHPTSPATVPVMTPNTNETNYGLNPGGKPTFERAMIPRNGFLNIPPKKLNQLSFYENSSSFNLKLKPKAVDQTVTIYSAYSLMPMECGLQQQT